MEYSWSARELFWENTVFDFFAHALFTLTYDCFWKQDTELNGPLIWIVIAILGYREIHWQMGKCGLWPSGIQKNLSKLNFFFTEKSASKSLKYMSIGIENFCLNRLWFWSLKHSVDFFFSRFCSFHFSFVAFCKSKNLQQVCLKYNCEPFCVFFQSWRAEH